MAKLTDKDLRERLETAIDKMMALVENEEEGSGRRTNAANALNGLIKTYKEKFNVAPEEGEGGVRRTKKKVSGWDE